MRRFSLRVGIVSLLILMARSAPAENPAATFSGVVVDRAGHAIEAARVTLRKPHGGCLWSAQGADRSTTTTDAEGRFTLPRPAEPMEVYVHHDDHAPAWKPVDDSVRVVLPRACRLTLELPTRAKVEVGHGSWFFARKEADGIVEFGPLPSGLLLEIVADAPGHVRTVISVVLKPGEQKTLRVEMDRGATIRGTVIPAQGGVRIEAHQGTTDRTVAWSEPDGSFSLTGLQERGARLVAIAPGKPVLVQDVSAGETVELQWK